VRGASDSERPVVALFDVDGTLTTGDCVVPFLRRATGWRFFATLARRPRALALDLLRRDRDALKALGCSSLAGLEAAALGALGERFAEEMLSSRLRGDTAARLRRHHELGHTVVLASASLEPYLAPFGRALAVDAVLCTRLEVGAAGRLTGRLDGANCRAAEKARRVVEWLGSADLDDAELWAYGDSDGDVAMLALADHPIRVDSSFVPADPR
jgi:phosphatidylglycerophosphatase C